METDQEKQIKIARKEFLTKVKNLDKLLEYQERFFDSFLKIKLAFLSFVGIIITIVIANKKDFSTNFLLILLGTSILSFLLLVSELLRDFVDRTKAMEKQYRRTMLAKIIHIATIRNNLAEYGMRAEELLIREEQVEQKMLDKESISEIIKYQGDKFSWFLFVIWLLILIGIPILFLLETLGKL